MSDFDEVYEEVPLHASRKRNRNFTEEDQLLLADLLKPYIDLVENKSCATKVTNQKDAAWASIAEQYNLNRPTIQRTSKDLRELYCRLKMKAKKEMSEFQRALEESDGIKKPASPSQTTKQIAMLISQIELEPTSPHFHSDATSCALVQPVKMQHRNSAVDVSNAVETLSTTHDASAEEAQSINEQSSPAFATPSQPKRLRLPLSTISKSSSAGYSIIKVPVVSANSRQQHSSSSSNLSYRLMIEKHQLEMKVLRAQLAAANEQQNYYRLMRERMQPRT